jgi:hypothetical protein
MKAFFIRMAWVRRAHFKRVVINKLKAKHPHDIKMP